MSGVGKNLHNHVAYFTKFYINEMDINPLNWATAVEFLLFRDGLMSGTGLSAVTAKIRSKYAEHPDDPDIQLYFGGYLAGCSKSGQIDEMLSDKKRSISIFPAVLYPKSRGYITIGSNDRSTLTDTVCAAAFVGKSILSQLVCKFFSLSVALSASPRDGVRPAQCGIFKVTGTKNSKP